jgi:tetratricopeptide (TPR) repeat protein
MRFVSLVIILFFISGKARARPIEVEVGRGWNANVVKLVDQAQDQMLKGDLAGARKSVDAAIQTDSNYWPALFIRAEVLMDQHSYEAAVQDCERILKQDSTVVEAALLRARANFYLGLYGISMKEVEHCLAFNRDWTLWPGSRRVLRSADLFKESAIFRGLCDRKTFGSRSSALLSFVTREDQRLFLPARFVFRLTMFSSRALAAARALFRSLLPTSFSSSGEAKTIGVGFEGGDYVGDNFVERHPKLFGAVDDLLAIDRAGERFVFHFLFDRREVDIVNALGWPNESDGDDETTQLVDCTQGFLQVGLRNDSGIIRVRQDRATNLLAPAVLAQPLNADKRMAFGGTALEIRMSFVIHVVKQADRLPKIDIFAALLGEVFHRIGDRITVFAQALGFHPVMENIQRVGGK